MEMDRGSLSFHPSKKFYLVEHDATVQDILHDNYITEELELHQFYKMTENWLRWYACVKKIQQKPISRGTRIYSQGST